MKLALDFGNTRIKAGLFGPGLQAVEYFTLSYEDWNFVSKKMDEYPLGKVVYSTVKTLPDEILGSLTARHAHRLTAQHSNLPFRLGYKTPETLGSDRVAAIAGAQALIGKENVLVIDAGTCITIDFIGNDQVFQGGAITPGVRMRYNSLHHFTGKLPQLAPPSMWSERLYGDNTETNMNTGVMQGILFEITGYIRAFEKRFSSLHLALTGGDGALLKSALKMGQLEPNLVLIGLNQIAELND